MKTSKQLLIAVILILSAFLIISITMIVYLFIIPAFPYETTDIKDYGKIKGNYDNETPKKIIESFFPDEISDDFDDVVYAYKSADIFHYAFEAYLEFTIKDEDKFKEHIRSVSEKGEWQEFHYDTRYRECIVSDKITLYHKHDEPVCNKNSDDHFLEDTEFCRILYSEEENRIIYTAIGIGKEDLASMGDFCKFFDRFDLDPMQFLISNNIIE